MSMFKGILLATASSPLVSTIIFTALTTGSGLTRIRNNMKSPNPNWQTGMIASFVSKRRMVERGSIFKFSPKSTACQAFRDLLQQYKFIQSMSGKGNCYDNAVAESFFHTLKTELIYFENYVTREDAKNSVFEYIEIYYNRDRMHSTLNYCSPMQFEQLWFDTKAA